MLRQIEWWFQNWPVTKSGVLPVPTLFLIKNFDGKFCFSLRTLTKSWFDVPTIQMPIFLLFVSAGVLFDSAFSMWVSLNGAIGICNRYVQATSFSKKTGFS